MSFHCGAKLLSMLNWLVTFSLLVCPDSCALFKEIVVHHFSQSIFIHNVNRSDIKTDTLLSWLVEHKKPWHNIEFWCALGPPLTKSDCELTSFWRLLSEISCAGFLGPWLHDRVQVLLYNVVIMLLYQQTHPSKPIKMPLRMIS